MSEGDEDFAAMFEASVKAKRFETGQTLEGTIVAIGPEVAFVDVGGKGEAQIEIAELKNAEGALEVAVGDRIQATVVSTAGASAYVSVTRHFQNEHIYKIIYSRVPRLF